MLLISATSGKVHEDPPHELRGYGEEVDAILPLNGVLPDALFVVAEAQRQAVNDWIRTSGEYDGVVDFDLAVRDPLDPAQLPLLKRADVLHPNDAGYALMGDSIDLALFKNGEGH